MVQLVISLVLTHLALKCLSPPSVATQSPLSLSLVHMLNSHTAVLSHSHDDDEAQGHREVQVW